REVRQLARQLGMQIAREAAVMLRDVGAAAAAARVAEQREVFAAWQPGRRIEDGELTKFDEMVAAAAGAQLRPGAILQARGHPGGVPIGIHHLVLPPRLERGADPELRLA